MFPVRCRVVRPTPLGNAPADGFVMYSYASGAPTRYAAVSSSGAAAYNPYAAQRESQQQVAARGLLPVISTAQPAMSTAQQTMIPRPAPSIPTPPPAPPPVLIQVPQQQVYSGPSQAELQARAQAAEAQAQAKAAAAQAQARIAEERARAAEAREASAAAARDRAAAEEAATKAKKETTATAIGVGASALLAALLFR